LSGQLVYSTYLGGNADDRGISIAVDNAGNAYIAGETLSTNFPITAGAFDTTYNGGSIHGDIFVSKITSIPVPVELSIFETIEGIVEPMFDRKQD